MDKKDFILKNYSRWVLFVCGLWLIGYWAGAIIQKVIPNWALNPLDNSPFEMLIISIIPIFGLIIEWYRQSRIWNRQEIEIGDILEAKKAPGMYCIVKGCYFPKGYFKQTLNLVWEDGNVTQNEFEGDFKLKFKGAYEKFSHQIKSQRNIPFGEDGIIIIYNHILKLWVKITRGDSAGN